MDEEQLDFQPSQMPGGVATPFVIRLTDLALVFQTRAQDIRVTSFTGALRAILREETRDPWDVVALSRSLAFREWRSTVDVVKRIRFRLERPNPNYEGRPEVERIIERLHLDVATLDLRSSDGVVTDEELVRQMLEHVELHYGEAVAAGGRDIDGTEVETVWDSGLQGETLIKEVPADPTTGEVTVDTLMDEVAALDADVG